MKLTFSVLAALLNWNQTWHSFTKGLSSVGVCFPLSDDYYVNVIVTMLIWNEIFFLIMLACKVFSWNTSDWVIEAL